MIELIRTNDPVFLSWLTSALEGHGIPAVVLDQHMSIAEGTIPAITRRVMVDEGDAARARSILDAGPEPAGDPGVAVTRDTLLGSRVTLFQPEDGYRAAIDPVLLAAAVPALGGQRVLDQGAGTGAAALCLAARVADVDVEGLELQSHLVELAAMGAVESGLDRRVHFTAGDLLRPPALLAPGSFDHVMANPPFQAADHGHASPEATKATAHVEGEADLEAWISAAVDFVRPKGSVTMIHRADRLDAILSAMKNRLGEIVVFPLWPVEGRQAKRVLVRGRKGLRTPLRLLAGLVLHERGGAYTTQADAILRNGDALNL